MPSAPVTPPATVADFKAFFVRGWKYSKGPDGVMDSDITNAIALACTVFNPGLFNSQEDKPTFLLAVAHFVVLSVQSVGGLSALPIDAAAGGSFGAGGGPTENTGSGVIDSKTAEKISIKYAGLEGLMKEYPSLAGFRQTDFGAQYALIVGPRLKCRVGIVSNPSDLWFQAPAVPWIG